MCNANDILNFETNLNLPREVRLGAKKIVYTYDAAGTKLRKIAYDAAGAEISRTDYIGGIQYESNVLKFMMTSEGRAVKSGSAWQYEYFHKDHLGNSRVVYGYQKQVDEYKATMESPTSVATKEQAQFYNIITTRVTALNRTPASIDVVAPDKSAETNGNLAGKAIGPAKMLQVTAGDRVQLEVFARYATGTGTNNTLITNLASAVTTTFQLVSGEAAFTALTNNVPVQAATITKASTVPKAYLFYILFNSSYVYQQFGYVQVSSAALAAHQQLYLDITIPTGGYLYTYVANESNVSASTSVYFDDFNIIHTRNTNTLQVVQTTDYYPFGLAMAAQSYQKQSSLDNDYLYNGKELQDEHNLGWLDYGKRMFDPHLGRWHALDPRAEKYESLSPYNYVLNNPLFFVDPDGDTVKTAGASEQAAYDDYKNEVNSQVKSYQGKVASQQGKVANAKTGFGRFFANAGFKAAQSNLLNYQGIQGEISNMESSTTTFMVRMGSNIVASLPINSGGSTTFNTATNQVDINIGSSSMFTTRQIVSHELLHGNQYLNRDLDFDATGLGGGLFYDKTDEIATFTRQNLFAPSSSNVVDVNSTVSTYYPSLDKGPKSFHLLTPIQQNQYNTLKSTGRVH